MNKEDRSILYGMVIGDGNLYLAKNNFGTEYCKLTIGHSPKQKEYLEYKIDILHSILGGAKPKLYEYSSYNKTVGKTYSNLQTVKTDKYFRQMHKKLYPLNKKIFTREILDFLDIKGLALWFMDDGSGEVCKNKNKQDCGCKIRISTYCSLEEFLIIQDWFKEVFDLECRPIVDKRNDKYVVIFNTQASKKLASLLEPYIPECMRYKISGILRYSPRVRGTQTSNVEGDDIVQA